MSNYPTTPNTVITTIDMEECKSITSIDTLIKDVVYSRCNIILNRAYLRDALSTTIVNMLQSGDKEAFENKAIEYATDYCNGQNYNIDYVGSATYDYSLCANMYDLIKVMRRLVNKWSDLGLMQAALSYDIIACTIAKFYDKDETDISFMLMVGTKYEF